MTARVAGGPTGAGSTARAPGPAAEPRKLLTVEDLAAMLGITTRGARLVCERGEIPAFRLGRRWYCRAEVLEDFFRAKEVEHRRDREATARLLRGIRGTSKETT